MHDKVIHFLELNHYLRLKYDDKRTLPLDFINIAELLVLLGAVVAKRSNSSNSGIDWIVHDFREFETASRRFVFGQFVFE